MANMSCLAVVVQCLGGMGLVVPPIISTMSEKGKGPG